MKYEVEKDLFIGKYILWEVHTNYKVEVMHGTKKECMEFKKKLERKNKNV